MKFLKEANNSLIKYIRLLCIFFIPLGMMIYEYNIINLFSYIGAFICLLNIIKEKDKWINFDKKILLVMLLFCIGIIISNYFAQINSENSIKYARRYCYWILPGLVMYGLWMNINKDACKKFLGAGLLSGTIILIVYAVYENMFLNIERPGSLTNQPNSWSAFLVMILPFLLYTFSNTFLKLLISLFVTYGIVLSQSRTSFVALIIIFLVYFILNKNKIRHIFTNKKVVFFILLFIATVFGLFYINKDNENVLSITNRMVNVESYNLERNGGDRVYLWKSSINMIKDNPIHGVGLQNFNQVYINDNYMNPKTKEPNLRSPHNIFLHYLVEMGLIGTIPFMLLLFTIFNFLRVNIKNDMARAMFISLIGILCNNMVDYQLITRYYYQLFWILILISVSDVMSNTKINTYDKK